MFLEPNFDGLILTEDLKDAIACAESPDEIRNVTDLCWKYRISSEKRGIYVFPFGPTLMRLNHYFATSDLALEAFKKGCDTKDFNFLQVYTVLMDLLFESGCYEDVLRCWEYYSAKSELGKTLPCPRSFQILVMGACYKIKTQESLDYAMKFLRYCQGNNTSVERKGLVFLSALATNMGDHALAFELLSLIKSPRSYVTGRSLLLFLQAKLGRFADALTLMEEITLADLPVTNFNDREIATESIKAVKTGVEATENGDLITKFRRLEKILREGQHLTAVSLESLFCSPVEIAPFGESGLLVEDSPLTFLAGTTEGDEGQLVNTSEGPDGVELEAEFRGDYSTDRRQNSFKKSLVRSVAAHVRYRGPFEVDDDKTYKTVNE